MIWIEADDSVDNPHDRRAACMVGVLRCDAPTLDRVESALRPLEPGRQPQGSGERGSVVIGEQRRGI